MTAGEKVNKKKTLKTKTVTAKKAVRKNSPKKKAAKRLQKKSSAKTLSSNTLVLSPILVINDAKALMQDISQLLIKKGDISIDASSVEMIDTAILQLLLAVTNQVKASKHNINWLNPSDNFISNVTLLGLSEKLGLSRD